ncbi:SAM-dependent methyltransferase [Paraliobacillus quinghaiensis]|uniref:SAM-dependent methyltransferase n=1 Tax=Paraliobacillus quinghaiensis TaxID=470815 RepID=A0A917WUL6_9BACI|nr:tRNA (adenine(22)-N(1))-methyltransferase TrmK [Paraliobacillus quinghaiensis]GGM31391.1 SAM-dependent methyltransferase [Paraliobacillus quinghaiensis]
MNNKVLSERLKTVAMYLPQNAYFADIGSDHAYLPCYICSVDPTATAIAGEINEGPFQSAKKHVQALNLENRVKVVKGDGLEVITNYDVRQIVIAGMGGGLIRSILDNGKDKLKNIERVIVQPNVDAHLVRKWFVQHHFELVAEQILKEDGHIYEILVADSVDETNVSLDEQKDILFGPYLLHEKNEAFIEKWQLEKINRIRIIGQMQKAKVVDYEKLEHFKQEVKLIEEVLRDARDDTSE